MERLGETWRDLVETQRRADSVGRWRSLLGPRARVHRPHSADGVAGSRKWLQRRMGGKPKINAEVVRLKNDNLMHMLLGMCFCILCGRGDTIGQG